MISALTRISGPRLFDIGIVGIGGVLPVLGFLTVAFWLDTMPSSILKVYTFTALAFPLSVYPLLYFAEVYGKNQSIYMNAAALLSVAYLNVFVYCTGGPMVSLFSFHYLYIPVVVGFAFGHRALKQAAWACWTTYVLNLAFVWDAWSYVTPWRGFAYNQVVRQAADEMSKAPSYIIAYAMIFTIQILMTYAMAKDTPKMERMTTA